MIAEENGIKYCHLDEDNSKEAFDLLTKVFHESEPIIRHLNISKQSVDWSFSAMWDAFMQSGLSLVAIDSTSGKVVGTTNSYDGATLSNLGCCKMLNAIFCIFPCIPSELLPMVEICQLTSRPKIPEILEAKGE